MLDKRLLQKRLAAEVLKCSSYRVRFKSDSESLKQIKEAITKADVRGLINRGIIFKLPAKGTSRVRARKILVQKRKGRRSGHGSRKGSFNARAGLKTVWINKVRKQRDLLKKLKSSGAIDNVVFWEMYSKVKGGFFRSVRHLKLYVQEKGLVKK